MPRHRRSYKRRKKSIVQSEWFFFGFILILVFGGVMFVMLTNESTQPYAWLVPQAVIAVVIAVGLHSLYRWYADWKERRNKKRLRRQRFDAATRHDEYHYMDPYEFEQYVVNLFKRLGYSGKVTQ